MNCPKCGKEGLACVVDTRAKPGGYIIRRRECMCGHRFNTIEISELNDKTLTVIRRLTNENCKPKTFDYMIYRIYNKIFHNSIYRKEKDMGIEEYDSGRIA